MADKKLPKGADQQGRYPEAAEPCTDVGHEDEMEPTSWFLVAVVLVFVVVVVVSVLEGA